jgi:hypothetical protein
VIGAARRSVIRSAPSRRLVLVPILLAHAAVLALLVAPNGAAVAPTVPGKSVALVDLRMSDVNPPAPQRAAVVTPPIVEMPPLLVHVPLQLPQISLAPPILSITDPLAAPGQACDLTGTVQRALRQDPAVRGALDMMPRDARSVANAVMLWDGHWIDGRDGASRSALERIRAVVLATVAQAPGICRTQAQAGPSLVTVPGEPDAVFALGSGQWRWDDMFVQSQGFSGVRSAANMAPSTLPTGAAGPAI